MSRARIVKKMYRMHGDFVISKFAGTLTARAERHWKLCTRILRREDERKLGGHLKHLEDLVRQEANRRSRERTDQQA